MATEQNGRTARVGRLRGSNAFIWSARLVVLTGFLAAWELFSNPRGADFMLVDKFYASQPTDIWRVLSRWISDGSVFQHMWITFQEMSIGFVIGAVLGFMFGLLLGTNPTIDRVLRPFVTMLYSVPRLALAPLFVVWFGLQMTSKVAFVALIVFFLVFYSTLTGVRNVERELIDVLRQMGASRAQVHWIVTVPSALTWIVAGLELSVPYALVGAVTGEIVSSNRGLGFLLVRSSGQFNVAGVFAAIVVMVVLALAVRSVVTYIESRLLRWRTLDRA